MKWMRQVTLGLFNTDSYTHSLRLLLSVQALKRYDDDVYGDDDCYNYCCYYYLLGMRTMILLLLLMMIIIILIMYNCNFSSL